MVAFSRNYHPSCIEKQTKQNNNILFTSPPFTHTYYTLWSESKTAVRIQLSDHGLVMMMMK